jgi:phosphate transport system substrate-binding protein
MSGQYQPLSRPIFIYVSAKAATQKPEVKAFIDAYLINANAYVKEVNFIPLPEQDLAGVTAHWQAQKTGSGFNGKPE